MKVKLRQMRMKMMFLFERTYLVVIYCMLSQYIYFGIITDYKNLKYTKIIIFDPFRPLGASLRVPNFILRIQI